MMSSNQFQPTQPVRMSWPKMWKQKVIGLMDRIYWACNRPIPLNITVLGPEKSGKTSVIRRYAGDIFYEEKVDPPKCAFRTISLYKFHNKLRRFNVNIVEVSKSKMTREEYERHVKNSSGILLIYSTDLPDSYNEIRSITQRTTSNNSKRAQPTVLVVGNKTEVSTSMNQVEQNTGIKDEVQSAGLNYFTVSAKLNWGVNDAFDELIELCAKKKVRSFKPLKRKRNRSRKPKSTESKLLNGDEDNTFDEI